jgi:hypothetical protein
MRLSGYSSASDRLYFFGRTCIDAYAYVNFLPFWSNSGFNAPNLP